VLSACCAISAIWGVLLLQDVANAVQHVAAMRVLMIVFMLLYVIMGAKLRLSERNTKFIGALTQKNAHEEKNT
jgi:hypothetical protein